MLQGLANLLLVGKNVSIVMVPIVINKDAFEPSYKWFKIHGLKLQLLLYQPVRKHDAQRTVSPQQMAAIIIRIKH